MYAHLADVYENKARYCLMLVSAEYAAKVWTNHERKSAQARALAENSEYILPVRFDDTEVPGLHRTIGYLRFDEHGPLGICKLLLDKLTGPHPSTGPSRENVPPAAATSTEYWTQRKRLADTDIIRKIWARARWCIWVRPTEFKRARFQDLDHCRNFMRSRQVRVGSLLPFPWVSNDALETEDEWIAGETDTAHQLERWAIFRSGQFVLNRAVDDSVFERRIHVLEVLDTVTQTFEFAARLAQDGIAGLTTAITFDLLGVDGWALTWPASGYTDAVPSCWSQDENVTATSSVTKDELTLRKQDLALDVTVELCSKLGWSEPPRARLETEQGRRFASIA